MSYDGFDIRPIARRGSAVWKVIAGVVLVIALGAVPLLIMRLHRVDTVATPISTDSALAAVAHRYELEALHPPISGLQPANVLGSDRQILTGCWQTNTGEHNSFEDAVAIDARNEAASVVEGLSWLDKLGLNFTSSAHRIQRVEVTFSGLTLRTADNLAFQWTNHDCLSAIDHEELPVVKAVLQLDSVRVSLVTDDGQRVSIDSASLRKAGITANVSADWHLASNGVASATGRNIAIGMKLRKYAIHKFTCPDTQAQALPLRIGEPLKLLGNCPGVEAERDWYRLRVASLRGNSAVVEVQPVGPAGGKPTMKNVELGAEVALATHATQADLLVVDRVNGVVGARVGRYDIYDPSLPPRIIAAADRVSGRGASAAAVVVYEPADDEAGSPSDPTRPVNDDAAKRLRSRVALTVWDSLRLNEAGKDSFKISYPTASMSVDGVARLTPKPYSVVDRALSDKMMMAAVRNVRIVF